MASAADLDASLFPPAEGAEAASRASPVSSDGEDMSDAAALDAKLFSTEPEPEKMPLVPTPPPPREQ